LNRQKKVFYSVQSSADGVRLARGGQPWPTGLVRSLLGSGFYCFDNLAAAKAYFGLKRQRLIDAELNPTSIQIYAFEVNYQNLNVFLKFDVRKLSDDDATEWLKRYSKAPGRIPQNHSYQYIIRTTGNYGVEYYFSPSAFSYFQMVNYVDLL
jgi:hypothetical protein